MKTNVNPDSESKLGASAHFQKNTGETKQAKPAASGAVNPVQRKNNNQTGLPDGLKAGIEQLSGYAMDDVRVHYGSSKPAQLQAHAYAQGSNIHLAPGQEKHLPHEAWHVVQQKQGRVKPTLQLQGNVPINDDRHLEKESDIMGSKAAQLKTDTSTHPKLSFAASQAQTVQRKVVVGASPATLLNANTAFVNNSPVSVGSEKAKWVTDGYARFYKDVDEFADHAQGRPVDVGLAKKLGRWYRLPFSMGKFFVVGENHGHFGYRELVQESNQTGMVLGEGGFNSLMTATQGSELQGPRSGLKTPDTGEAQETTMENLAGKAYFALALKTKPKDKTPDWKKEPKKQLPEEEWLKNYQAADPKKRIQPEDFLATPAYRDEEGNRVTPVLGSHAETYKTSSTADGIVGNLAKQLREYAGPPNERVTKAQEAMLAYLDDTEDADILETLLTALQRLAMGEAMKFHGIDSDTGPQFKSLQSEIIKRAGVSKDNQGYKDHMMRSMAHRDYIMYQSVLKAKNKGGYIMAGMGNNHAQNLKKDLETQGVPVILYEAFTNTPLSVDALAPLEEERGYAEAVDHTEKQRDSFIKKNLSLWLKRFSIPESPQLTQALVPFLGGPTAPKPLRIDPEVLKQLQGISLPQSAFHILEQLLPELRLPLGGHTPSTPSKPLALSAPKSKGEDTGPSSQPYTMPPKSLVQIRKLLANLYVLPKNALPKESGKTGILLTEDEEVHGMSLVQIFDKLLWFVEKTASRDESGAPIFYLSGTLTQNLLRLYEEYLQNGGSLNPQAEIKNTLTHLFLVFELTGLGSLTQEALLAFLQQRQNQKKQTSTTHLE